jgi:hypothetical protein
METRAYQEQSMSKSLPRLLAFLMILLTVPQFVSAQGLEAPIETRRTPQHISADPSPRGIILTSKAPHNPFTMELAGRSVKARGSARLALEIDGRLIALSTVRLQSEDAAAPQEQLLNAFQAHDSELLGRQGWQLVEGSQEAFAFPSGQACLYWAMHTTGSTPGLQERHLATAITRLGANIVVIEGTTTEATGLADLKEYLKTALLTLKPIELASPSGQHALRPGEMPDEMKRASAGARMAESVMGIPHRTLLNIERASDEDAREVGTIRLSSEEMIAAALRLLRKQGPPPPLVGAIVFDGRSAHAINLTGYIAEEGIVQYWDPWGKGSFLAAGSNMAAVEAVPSPTQKRIWHVREDQLERVLYAMTLEFNEVLALNEDLPLRTFQGLGDRLQEAIKQDLFTFFHLEPSATTDRLGGKRAVTFRPSGKKFHDAVAVTVTVNETGRILDVRLDLHRSLIDGEDLVARASAADIVKSFLAAATAEDDAPYVTPLIHELSSVMMQGALVHRSTPMPNLPLQPTKGFLTYLGKEKEFDQRLTRSLLRLQNTEVDTAPMLVVSLETSRRVPPRH